MAGDHPDIPFVQCKGFTKGRALGPPIWIVVHDMEASESTTTAEGTAAYGANPKDGRQVSWHYAADNDSIIQCVRLGDTAWAVGNIGNQLGISWELAGFATQLREQWLDTYDREMFAKIVPIMVRDMRTYGIPARWLTDAQVKAKEKGLTTHDQMRRVWGGTTHTDPGPNFPYDYVLGLIQDELDGDDMSATTTTQVAHIEEILENNLVPWLEDTAHNVDKIVDTLTASPSFVTALAKAIVLELRE